MSKWIILAGGVGMGVVVGALSGLLGIGGGIVMVPALVLLWGLTAHAAVGTSLAVMIPTAIAGAVRHHSFGHVDWRLAAGLAVGAIFGTYLLGAPLANALPEDVLKRVFGVVMILVGLHMAGVFSWLASLAR